jgi:CYTH domain-containing protein
MSEPKLEIERKFILKRIPFDHSYDEMHEIVQFYYLDDDGSEARIRRSINLLKGMNVTRPTEGYVFTKTKKRYVSHGVCEEDEAEITEKEFYVLRDRAYSEIHKRRYVKRMPNELRWEIDSYNFGLTVAEIELPSIYHKLDIPDFIKNVMLIEVTGRKEFSNSSLAERYK